MSPIPAEFHRLVADLAIQFAKLKQHEQSTFLQLG